jgi:hypothetical protein
MVAPRRKSTVLIMAAATEASLVAAVREGTTWTGIGNGPETAIANEVRETVNESERESERENVNVRGRRGPNGRSENVGETSHHHQLPGKIRRRKRGRGRNERRKRKRSAESGTLRMTDRAGELVLLLNCSPQASPMRMTESVATQKIAKKTQVNADQSEDSDILSCKPFPYPLYAAPIAMSLF